VRCSDLDDRGLAIDFKDVRSAANEVLEELDHSVLNELEPFQIHNPSAENLARYIHHRMSSKINADMCRIWKVAVQETPGCSATYLEDVPRPPAETLARTHWEAPVESRRFSKPGVEAIDHEYAPDSSRVRRSVVCVSGGLDSAVTAAMAANESDELYFFHANYGQRTEQKEQECFNRLCDHFKVRNRFIADLRYLGDIGGSSLTDVNMPVETAELNRKTIPSTYVPFRNAQILAAAVGWAEALAADAVYVGAVAEDNSGYPDCQPEFFDAFQKATDRGTRPETQIQIRTPVIGLNKAEIIQRGEELKTPFELTWSCYKSEGPACGGCDSCALRLQAFKDAGIQDGIPYEKPPPPFLMEESK